VTDQKWYTEFFGEDYLRIYDSILPPKRAEREVDKIVERLELRPGSAILDLCCGHGRHAVALAERGYRVTGLDLSTFFLEKAAAAAAEAGVDLRLVHGDMRHIPFEEEFDAVINMFSAFGYLESEEEDQKVLSQVRKALKPGGLFLLETIHHASLMRNFEPQAWNVIEDHTVVLEEREMNLRTGRNEVTVTLIRPDGTRREYEHAMRIYTAAELIRMLTEADLEIDAVYGGLDGAELTLEARRLVVIARKRSVATVE
jgi:SAM-dependent methyltransferase